MAKIVAHAFRLAARDGKLAVVKLFVAAGMSVNAKHGGGWTAQEQAAYNGHTAVANYLESVGG